MESGSIQDQGACSFDGMDDYPVERCVERPFESSSYSISFLWIRKLALPCEPLIIVSQWNSVASSGQSLHVGYRPCGQTGCVNGGCFFHDTALHTCQTGSLTGQRFGIISLSPQMSQQGRSDRPVKMVFFSRKTLESWQGNFSQGLSLVLTTHTGGFTEAWMDGQFDEL